MPAATLTLPSMMPQMNEIRIICLIYMHLLTSPGVMYMYMCRATKGKLSPLQELSNSNSRAANGGPVLPAVDGSYGAARQPSRTARGASGKGQVFRLQDTIMRKCMAAAASTEKVIVCEGLPDCHARSRGGELPPKDVLMLAFEQHGNAQLAAAALTPSSAGRGGGANGQQQQQQQPQSGGRAATSTVAGWLLPGALMVCAFTPCGVNGTSMGLYISSELAIAPCLMDAVLKDVQALLRVSGSTKEGRAHESSWVDACGMQGRGVRDLASIDQNVPPSRLAE